MGKFSSILLGTLSGAAAAVFLTSKKGKEIDAKTQTTIVNYLYLYLNLYNINSK